VAAGMTHGHVIEHVGEQRHKADFEKRAPIVMHLNRDRISSGQPSSWWLWGLLALAVVGGVGGVVYKVRLGWSWGAGMKCVDDADLDPSARQEEGSKV